MSAFQAGRLKLEDQLPKRNGGQASVDVRKFMGYLNPKSM